ncbi:MAG: hypothetical protein PHY87_02445, partial [Sphaerochaeta sp.]|nr:hypothetical protein [Sphaerochaeta sp.]
MMHLVARSMYGLGKGMEKDEHQQVEGDGDRYRNAKAQPELHASVQQEGEQKKEGQGRKDKIENR